jgi:hypothetical protein
MPQPRSSQVSLSDTPWYHAVSRCVRWAYLCGADAHSGQSFVHRRGRSADETLRRWTQVFAGPPLVQRFLADRDAPEKAETGRPPPAVSGPTAGDGCRREG